jgi:hypothetical protein
MNLNLITATALTDLFSIVSVRDQLTCIFKNLRF